MSIQDWGAIGEIIGGIAVIMTLIYLSVQVRQANVSTHRNMYAQSATAVSDYWLTLAREPELYAAFVAMLRDPDAQDPRDLDRGFLVMDAFLSLMESYYLHNREYGEHLSQERWDRVLSRFLNTPGGRRYWPGRQRSFHAEFAVYINSLFDETAPGFE